MSKGALFAFAAVLWVAPAVVAGMLDWPGIWGGGSAFSDLIVPAPITGGILHVPSFVATLILVGLYPGLSDRAAGVLRIAVGVAVFVGLSRFVDLESLHTVLFADEGDVELRFQQDYFGLCLLTDASIATIWLAIARRETSG